MDNQSILKAAGRSLLSNLDSAHEAYYRAEVFSGPSLFFHLRSLDAMRQRNLGGFSENVYAVLAAWGMHRMGPGGSKMKEFDVFSHSVKAVWQRASRLGEKVPATLTEPDWETMREIFTGLQCMASSTSLVGNSKVMAHLIPNLIPPVDREYTLRFLFNNTSIRNDITSEWVRLRQILEGFFYPLIADTEFQEKASGWMQRSSEFRWDTSPLKIADNLVIGAVKQMRRQEVL